MGLFCAYNLQHAHLRNRVNCLAQTISNYLRQAAGYQHKNFGFKIRECVLF